jgi:hypothetical protein
LEAPPPIHRTEIRLTKAHAGFANGNAYEVGVEEPSLQSRTGCRGRSFPACAFAVIAGVLATIGIYGAMSVTTAQRTRELGVRLALGAARHDILGMVFRQGAIMTGLARLRLRPASL